jgi:hypothetical protein
MSDAVLGKVLVFNTVGYAGVKILGSFGDGAAEMMLPIGMEVLPWSSDLLVADYLNGRIQVYNSGALIP